MEKTKKMKLVVEHGTLYTLLNSNTHDELAVLITRL